MTKTTKKLITIILTVLIAIPTVYYVAKESFKGFNEGMRQTLQEDFNDNK